MKIGSERNKFAVKILSLVIAVFLIVISTIFVPKLITSNHSQNPEAVVKYISTQPVLGLPIPFYINGRTLRLQEAEQFHKLKFPFYFYFGNPYDSPGASIDYARFLFDFLLLFVPMLTILIFKRKTRRKHIARKLSFKMLIKIIAVIFVISFTFIVSSLFLYPRTFFVGDFFDKCNSVSLGLPMQFVYIDVHPNNFPYHLPTKVIIKSFLSQWRSSIGPAVFIFFILLLLYYAYAD